MTAYLTRTEKQTSYAYHLTIENSQLAGCYRLYRTSGYRYYIKIQGEKIIVYFNQYLFPQFEQVPMTFNSDDETFEMLYNYRQLPGGASAPYEIITKVAI